MGSETSGIWYHWKVKDIKRAEDNSDYMIVTISPEWTQNPKDKTYKVLDIFFQTTEDKIRKKIVYVKESATWELLKLLNDNFNVNDKEVRNAEVFFRYDTQILNIYSHVSLMPIKNTLRENVKKYLNSPESRLYIKDLLLRTPAYIRQYWYFSKFTKKLEKDENYQFTIYDSEHIHFYCAAYDAALLLLKSKCQQNTSGEISTIDAYYTLYQDKVVDELMIIWYDTFEWYVDMFKEEIIHNNKWHTTSLREQHILHMYDSLHPHIKYYFFSESLTLPIDKVTYNYLVALYHMQEVYDNNKTSITFHEVLDKLIKLYDTAYPCWLPTQKRNENNILLFDSDLHEHETFNQDVWAQVLLNEFFDYLAEELYEAFINNIHVSDQQKSYGDILDINIRERLNNDTLNVQRFYYCLQILEEIHHTSLANKG